ncbi:hypothetical protein DIPPA_21360 [Diplonema papillatum]|nr:hypothetical protein DIPPA_21360 [Diplonema papillatum]|eukprot:gene3325-5209_t
MLRCGPAAVVLVALGCCAAAGEELVKVRDLKVSLAATSTKSQGLSGKPFAQEPIVQYNGFQYAAIWISPNDSVSVVAVLRRHDAAETWESLSLDDVGMQQTSDTNNYVSLCIGREDGTVHLVFDQSRYRVSKPGLATGTWTAAAFITSPVHDLLDLSLSRTVYYPRLWFNTGTGTVQMGFEDGNTNRCWWRVMDYFSANGTYSAPRTVIGPEGVYSDSAITNSSSRCAMLNTVSCDSFGRLHITWTWRERDSLGENHDIAYAYTDDGGVTWFDNNDHLAADTRADEILQLDTPDLTVIPLDAEKGFMNQQAQTVDSRGRVHLFFFRCTPKRSSGRFGVTADHRWYHYHRTVDGEWEGTQLPYDEAEPWTLADFRAALYVDDDDRLYAVYRSYSAVGIIGGFAIATAGAGTSWSDWSLAHEEIGFFSCEPRAVVAGAGISVIAQFGDPSPSVVKVLDFAAATEVPAIPTFVPPTNIPTAAPTAAPLSPIPLTRPPLTPAPPTVVPTVGPTPQPIDTREPAPATDVPVTAAPVSKTVKDAQFTQDSAGLAVGVTAFTGAFTADGSSAMSASRLVLLGESCNLGQDVLEYSSMLHPSQLSLWGDLNFGMAVGNLAIVSSFTAVHYALAQWMGRVVCTSFAGSDPLGCFFFPSIPIVLFNTMLQGIVLGSVRMIVQPHASFSPYVGCFLFIATLAALGFITCHIIKNLPQKVAYVKDPRRPRIFLYSFFFGSGEWVNKTAEDWAGRFASVLRGTKGPAILYFLVESLATVAIAAVFASKALSFEQCAWIRLVAAGCVGVQVAALWVMHPRLKPKDAVCEWVFVVCQAVAMALKAVAYFQGASDSVVLHTADVLLRMAIAAVFLRSVTDIVCEIILLCRGTRQNLQDRYSEKQLQLHHEAAPPKVAVLLPDNVETRSPPLAPSAPLKVRRGTLLADIVSPVNTPLVLMSGSPSYRLLVPDDSPCDGGGWSNSRSTASFGLRSALPSPSASLGTPTRKTITSLSSSPDWRRASTSLLHSPLSSLKMGNWLHT